MNWYLFSYSKRAANSPEARSTNDENSRNNQRQTSPPHYTQNQHVLFQQNLPECYIAWRH